MIIDFHTHTFPQKISARVVEKLAATSCSAPFTDGSAEDLAASMKKAGVDWSVNLPVMTYAEQTEKVNASLITHKDELLAQGIITFGGIHPDDKDFRGELKRLKAAGIGGIKLHPAYQGVEFDDPRIMRILDCANELGLIVVTHAGVDIGIYDHDYCSVAQILHVLKEVRPERLVLAHMGGWARWDEVERDLAGAPVWLDTAFSIGPVTPWPKADRQPYRSMNLTEEAFVRLVRKHGANRVLFATDSPWEDQADYIGRMERMPLTDAEKQAIFGGNATALLGIAQGR